MKRTIRCAIIAVIVLWGLAQPIGLAAPRSDWFIYLPLIARPKENPLHTGIATYYDATGDGACMFGPSPNDLMVTALNAEEYSNAAYCGAYVQVNGAKGSIVVRIVDLCPECLAGHLDLSYQAFAAVDGGADSQPSQSHCQIRILERQPMGDGAARVVQLLRANQSRHGRGAVHFSCDGYVH